jgi:hypothetical protein
LYGAILFALALGLRWLLGQVWPAYPTIEAELVDYIRPLAKEEVGVKPDGQTRRAEWVVTAVYSLVLGIVSGALLNVFTPRRWALERQRKCVRCVVATRPSRGFAGVVDREYREGLHRVRRFDT